MGVNAIGFAALALLTTLALSRVHRRRPWDAAGFAVAPLLVLTGLASWDLLAVAAIAVALWAWSRGRPVLAGVLVGLGDGLRGLAGPRWSWRCSWPRCAAGGCSTSCR